MRDLTECLVCSGRQFETYAENTFSGSVMDAAQYFLANRRGVVHGKILECLSCGFRFTSPQFEVEEYDEIYKAAPGRDSSDVPLEKSDMRRFKRLARFVGLDVGGEGRFLDFGCGRGGFLAAMNEKAGLGFDVGEPATFRVGPSTVMTGKFFDLIGREPFRYGSFDFITAFDVFEHLPELDKYIGALAQLLTPSGRLIVTVPDVDSWTAKLSGRRWNMYLLEHLWFFGKNTLKAFMGRCRFHQTRHRKVPYDATLAHIARRVAQTYAPAIPSFGHFLPEVILPVPIGVMYGVFERSAPA